ncbi:MAG: Sensory transduction regulatory protein [Candidatus Kaiserbacteria bacterium]|nr:Sensory transduction regulatory protein [Candidatus Kaiserbacteria bacterium]
MDTPERAFDPLGDSKDGHILTRAIIDTIREPLIVLDETLHVVVASRSFYKKFDLTHETSQGKPFYKLGNGQWNIPALCTLLEEVIPKHTTVEGFEFEHDFPFLGLRTLVVNAREIRYEHGEKKMLLSMLDVTHQRRLEIEREKLIQQKDLLLKEMRHRIANSLQLIASILLLKAETVDSAESRSHLEDAHERIMTIATVQQQLDPMPIGEEIAVAGYLTSLCKSLSRSMIGGRKPIVLKVIAGKGTVSSDTAVSFGLVTTELVINALKHGFPNGQSGTITVCYESEDSGWTLSISDDGVGKTKKPGGERPGLGTSIVGALANQLQAVIRTETSDKGTKVVLMHAHM